MPGTIQVTVLEFKGFSSSSKASAKSLKVSMGKRQFQTWDKGDFSFPITKLGEDLVVSLLDAGGNEIAHQDIRTMQIIEKGNWDEVFAIDGGGHAHMKLSFVLSEEERHRIRLMRESAVKKKLETNPNIKLRLLQGSDSVEMSTKNEQKIADELSPKVEVSQAGSSLPSATSCAIPSSHRENNPESALIPDATDVSQCAPSFPEKHEVKSESPKMQETVADHESTETKALANVRSEEPGSPTSRRNETVAPQLQDEQNSRSNVRKMISALENSKSQEVKSLKKASSVAAQLNRFTRTTEDQESKHDGSAEAPKELSSGENDVQKLKILMRQSTSERATSSGRMASNSWVVEGSGRGASLKSSNNEECFSGMWIFPDNTTRLCVTTAGHHQNVQNISSKSNVLDKNVMHERELKTEKKQNEAEAGSGSSPNGSFNGVIGQVIKIGAIIGFGVLVLLTRQKEPRIKHREENDNLYRLPEYV